MGWIPFSNKQLAKIGTYGAVFIVGNVVLMHYLIQKRFHQSPYFTTAAGIVLEHRPLMEYFGDPVKFGNPNLSDNKSNFSTESEAKFEVPIKGLNAKGTMSFHALRDPSQEDVDKRKWNVVSLEVMVDDRPNEKVVLVRS